MQPPYTWLGSLMLRRKLLVAFSAMAVLTALCGTVAYYFVNRIGAAVTVFSDVTQPLAEDSLALSTNAERMLKGVLKAVNENGSLEDAAQQLAAVDGQGRAIIARMQKVAADGKVNVDFRGIEHSHAAFVSTLDRILKDDARGRDATAESAAQQTEFEDQRHQAYDALTGIARQVAGLTSELEEKAKVERQIGSATTENLGRILSQLFTEIDPTQRYISQLLLELGALEEIARQAPKYNAFELAAARKEATDRAGRIERTIENLGGRLREQGAKVEYERIKPIIVGLSGKLSGVLDGRSKALAARAQIAVGRGRLNELEQRYTTLLAQVRAEIETLNQAARGQAKAGIANARSLVTAAALLAVLAALVFATFFARRISQPLMRLTAHATEIRESGELMPLSDETINTREDEVGKLAKSFNSLVVELADARRRLIEWSEAEIKAQYERLNAAVNNMPIGLCMFDAEQKLIICNARYAEIYHLDETLTKPGTSLRTILTQRAENQVYAEGSVDTVEERLAQIALAKPWHQINELSNGRVIAISHHPLANGGSIATHEDITERRMAEQQIAYMAHHDALTDLPNRVSFREAIVKALAGARGEAPVAVHCLDLDHFKAVNDTLGHPIGDTLLKQVGHRLLGCVREADTVARLGGDEFSVVQVSPDQPVAATALANRLIDELSKPYEVEGHQVVIGASVGITIAPGDGTDPDLLMKKADMALYRAKQNGRGVYAFFEPGMDAEMQARRLLELDLRKAVALNEFELYYQPTVSVQTGDITGFEALLRWHHPERGMLLPLEFVPLAEEIGLINQIGSWVLKRACTDAATWPEHINVSVNVSPVQFRSRTLVLDVIAALGASGLPARRLEIEITEAVLLNDTDATVATLNELRDLGVHIAMDDFGTGYSSIGYLQKFPFDKIKIDRSFVHGIRERSDSRAIVRAVAGLGSTLGIVTTAEGVETDDELKELKREGCTEVQGYLYSEPRPVGELEAYIRKFKAKSASAA